MRPAKARTKRQFGTPGKSGPAIYRVYWPKTSALELLHPDWVKSKSKTPETDSRVPELPISHGASPVASVLGIRSGATPRGFIHVNIAPSFRASKQDISTLPGIGHFYFALTTDTFCLTVHPPRDSLQGNARNLYL